MASRGHIKDRTIGCVMSVTKRIPHLHCPHSSGRGHSHSFLLVRICLFNVVITVTSLQCMASVASWYLFIAALNALL